MTVLIQTDSNEEKNETCMYLIPKTQSHRLYMDDKQIYVEIDYLVVNSLKFYTNKSDLFIANNIKHDILTIKDFFSEYDSMVDQLDGVDELDEQVQQLTIELENMSQITEQFKDQNIVLKSEINILSEAQSKQLEKSTVHELEKLKNDEQIIAHELTISKLKADFDQNDILAVQKNNVALINRQITEIQKLQEENQLSNEKNQNNLIEMDKLVESNLALQNKSDETFSHGNVTLELQKELLHLRNDKIELHAQNTTEIQLLEEKVVFLQLEYDTCLSSMKELADNKSKQEEADTIKCINDIKLVQEKSQLILEETVKYHGEEILLLEETNSKLRNELLHFKCNETEQLQTLNLIPQEGAEQSEQKSYETSPSIQEIQQIYECNSKLQNALQEIKHNVIELDQRSKESSHNLLEIQQLSDYNSRLQNALEETKNNELELEQKHIIVIQSIQESNVEMLKESSDKSHEIQKLAEYNSKLQNELDKLENHDIELKQEHNVIIDNIQAKNAAKQIEICTYLQEIEQLKESNSQFQKELMTTQNNNMSQMASQNIEIQQLTDKQEIILQDNDKYSQEIEKLNSQNFNIQIEMADMQKCIEKQVDRIALFSVSEENMTKTIEELNHTNTQMKNESVATELDVIAYLHQIETLNTDKQMLLDNSCNISCVKDETKECEDLEIKLLHETNSNRVVRMFDNKDGNCSEQSTENEHIVQFDELIGNKQKILTQIQENICQAENHLQMIDIDNKNVNLQQIEYNIQQAQTTLQSLREMKEKHQSEIQESENVMLGLSLEIDVLKLEQTELFNSSQNVRQEMIELETMKKALDATVQSMKFDEEIATQNYSNTQMTTITLQSQNKIKEIELCDVMSKLLLKQNEFQQILKDIDESRLEMDVTILWNDCLQSILLNANDDLEVKNKFLKEQIVQNSIKHEKTNQILSDLVQNSDEYKHKIDTVNSYSRSLSVCMQIMLEQLKSTEEIRCVPDLLDLIHNFIDWFESVFTYKLYVLASQMNNSEID